MHEALIISVEKKVAASYFCVNHYGFSFLISDKKGCKCLYYQWK